ncbi:restriction endonuclease subunit S [uncultured Anaerovibrio sp.]|uniref:restriction endonuclease subunit S n=1 Tax=uncultured Anaerovibrio sp. TaxID=361586 RepID=UPI002624DDE7|nr:restriction endonuclease subunit S [uncultured Anaerovibrio sp.]
MNTPNIRFKGFSDDWEQRKLGDCCREFKSGSFIPTSDIEESGEYPVFGGNGLRGYASEYNHDGEFALIGRQGALCGNMNYSEGKAYFTEHAVAVQANESANTKFMYYLLDKMNLGQYSGQSAQPGLAVGKLVKLEELFPSVDEQKNIGRHFTIIDILITLYQRKCDSLKQVKNYMLQKMFPKQGEKVPEIRFAGFTGDWEQRKLGDVVGVYDGTHQTPNYQNSGVMFVSVEDIQTLSSEKYISEEDYKRNYSVVPEQGDILMTRIGDIGTANIVKKAEPLAFYVSLALLKNRGLNAEFLKANISAPEFQNELWLRTLHTAYPKKINKDEIGKCIISIAPCIDEQKQIGNFFEKIDNLIALHQRKSDSLKEIKKFMLQNMFLQNMFPNK